MIYTIFKQNTDEVVAKVDTQKGLIELANGYALVTTEQNKQESERTEKINHFEPFPEGTGHPAYGGIKLL